MNIEQFKQHLVEQVKTCNQEEYDALRMQFSEVFGCLAKAYEARFPSTIGRIQLPAGIPGPKSKEDPFGQFADFSHIEMNNDGVLSIENKGRVTQYQLAYGMEFHVRYTDKFEVKA